MEANAKGVESTKTYASNNLAQFLAGVLDNRIRLEQNELCFDSGGFKSTPQI
jgi:hypothetical protein